MKFTRPTLICQNLSLSILSKKLLDLWAPLMILLNFFRSIPYQKAWLVNAEEEVVTLRPQVINVDNV